MPRLLFAQAEVKYEDKRIPQTEWPALKPTTPTGSLPILEVDGKQLTGSGPIARFLGERFGLAGDNDFENAEIASIVDVLNDCLEKTAPALFEKDAEKKAALMKKIKEEVVPQYFGILEKKIQSNMANGNGFIYGKKPTYADFTIFQLLSYFKGSLPEILDKYPGMVKLNEAVSSLENVAKWIKERPAES